jgi:hypothetical protein
MKYDRNGPPVFRHSQHIVSARPVHPGVHSEPKSTSDTLPHRKLMGIRGVSIRGKILILALWLFAQMSHGALSFLPATNEVNLLTMAHSFDTSPNVVWSDAIATYLAAVYPQYTNHIWSWSRSGNGLEADYENDEPGRTMPFLHFVDTNLVAWDLFMAGDDNGGYTSNQVIQWSTNIMAGPNLVWNRLLGVATNEGITFPTVIHIPIGGIPEDNPGGGGANQINRNNAATNLAAISGVAVVDMWHLMWTNGVSSDITNNRYFGFLPGNHAYNAGYLCMALKTLIELGAETNIASITFNWADSTASTNHCTTSGISLNGDVLTATVHWDRMPGAWDVPDGTITNDCRNAFLIMPELGNAFQWIVQVTNLPAGNYNVFVDGVLVDSATSSQLIAGRNWFTNYNGPLWNQRVSILNAKRDQEGNDHVTLLPTHGAGDLGLGNRYDLINYYSGATTYPGTYTGNNYMAAMAPVVSQVKVYDLLIHNAAQQTNHIFTISPAGQTITFPAPGDQIYGVAPLALGATASSGLTIIYNVASGPATVSGNVLTITGAGSVTVQATQSGNATWPAADLVSRTITVAQKALTPSITVTNKTYDGTSTASIATRGLTGVIGGDSVSLSGGSAAFSDKPVGVGKTVTATGLSLTGTVATNYVLTSTSATTTANITPAVVTVTGVTAADKVYDGTTSATVSATDAVLSGIVGGDTVSFSGSASGVFIDSGAAAGKTVTVSGLILAGADAGNYSLALPTTTASITKASTLNAVNASLNPAPTSSNVTFSATLTVVPPGGGTPTGNVIFRDGATILGTNALNVSATATFNTGTLSHSPHTIIAEYSGDQNFLGSTNSFAEVIDAPPTIASVSLTRYVTGGTKVRLSALLTNATDLDGDTLTLVSLSSTTASGVTIITNGDWIFYQPPDGFTNSDVFSWTVADSFGLTATGSIAVVVIPDTNAPQNFASSLSEGGINPNGNPDHPSVQFLGIPFRVYTVQFTTNLLTQDWQTLGTAAADKSGFIEFFVERTVDSPPRTYRTTYP